MKFKLYPFQKEGRDFLLSHQRCLNADQMGLGKSVQVLSAIEYLIDNGEAFKILIVAPKSLLLMWEDMIVDCLGRDFRKYFTLVSYNYIQIVPRKKRESEKQKKRRLKQNAQVNDLLKTSWDVIVADEMQKCKNWTCQTTRGWRHLIKGYRGYVWMLTGTPATKNGGDYYTYLKTVYPDKWWTFSEFKNWSCNVVKDFWSGGFKFDGVSNVAKPVLKKEFRKFKIRRLMKNVLDQLPKEIVQYIPVKVDKSVVKACLDARAKYNLNGDKIDPHLGVVLRSVGLGKVAVAIEYVEDAGEPVVIFAIHTEVIEKIAQGLRRKGFKVGTITGKDSTKDRHQTVKDFQSGKLDHVSGNIEAAGVGITLTRARCTLFVEQSWKPDSMWQAAARVKRIGQKASCLLVTHLVGKGTTDEYIIKNRAGKEEFMKEVMGDE